MKTGITTQAIHTINVSENELRNIVHGLELLQAKAFDLQQNVQPFVNGEMRKFFQEKAKEIHAQSAPYRKLLRNP